MQSPSVLVIHNCYQQPGGEGAAVGAEINLLRNAGHRVMTYFRDNCAIASYSPLKKASLLVSTTWNRRTYADLRTLIRQERPDIVHCHNFLPLISPPPTTRADLPAYPWSRPCTTTVCCVLRAPCSLREGVANTAHVALRRA